MNSISWEHSKIKLQGAETVFLFFSWMTLSEKPLQGNDSEDDLADRIGHFDGLRDVIRFSDLLDCCEVFVYNFKEGVDAQLHLALVLLDRRNEPN